MAEASIPVDLLNPGQVFACLGFVEAAEVLHGEAEAAFDWSDRGQVLFHLRTLADEDPVVAVLRFLDEAEVYAEHVPESDNIEGWKAGWGNLAESTRPNEYPFPDPQSPATLVCKLTAGPHEIRIDHWGDITRDNVKFWAGSGGYPGAALARDALKLLGRKAVQHASDPFAFSQPQTSSFRLDWRRDYIPLDAGFSLNVHGNIGTKGFPIVELLAAIGLSHARPLRQHKLEYRYGVVGRDRRSRVLWLPPAMLRAGLGLAELEFPMRRFRMQLDWPGQENQARAITNVVEEN